MAKVIGGVASMVEFAIVVAMPLSLLATETSRTYRQIDGLTVLHLHGGYTRKVAKLKDDGEMKMTVGKQPMSEEGCIYLAKKALRHETDFGHYITVHTLLESYGSGCLSCCYSV